MDPAGLNCLSWDEFASRDDLRAKAFLDAGGVVHIMIMIFWFGGYACAHYTCEIRWASSSATDVDGVLVHRYIVECRRFPPWWVDACPARSIMMGTGVHMLAELSYTFDTVYCEFEPLQIRYEPGKTGTGRG